MDDATNYFELALTMLITFLFLSVPVVVPFVVTALRSIRSEKAQKLVLLLIEQLHKALTTGVEASIGSGQTVPEVIYREAISYATSSNPDLMKQIAPKGKDTPPEDVLKKIAKSKLEQVIASRVGGSLGSVGGALSGAAIDAIADRLRR